MLHQWWQIFDTTSTTNNPQRRWPPPVFTPEILHQWKLRISTTIPPLFILLLGGENDKGKMEIDVIGVVVVCFTLHTVCGRFALPVRKRHWWGFAAPTNTTLFTYVNGSVLLIRSFSMVGRNVGVERLASGC